LKIALKIVDNATPALQLVQHSFGICAQRRWKEVDRMFGIIGTFWFPGSTRASSWCGVVAQRAYSFQTVVGGLH